MHYLTPAATPAQGLMREGLLVDCAIPQRLSQFIHGRERCSGASHVKLSEFSELEHLLDAFVSDFFLAI